ncbi:hypothetical protein OKW29_001136 [Paraburkholderia sp. CI3]
MRPALTDHTVSPADWMSAIDGSRLLSALTLPGSHDTCAYTVDGIHEQLAERLAARPEPCGTLMLDFCDWQDWRLVDALIDCNWSR